MDTPVDDTLPGVGLVATDGGTPQPVQVPYLDPHTVRVNWRGVLVGGEPGHGKSVLLSAVVAHAALSLDCRRVLLDGKLVELGQWRHCADVFVGASQPQAIATLQRLQTVVDNRSAYLLELERRKVVPGDRWFTPY